MKKDLRTRKSKLHVVGQIKMRADLMGTHCPLKSEELLNGTLQAEEMGTRMSIFSKESTSVISNTCMKVMFLFYCQSKMHSMFIKHPEKRMQCCCQGDVVLAGYIQKKLKYDAISSCNNNAATPAQIEALLPIWKISV